MNYNYHTHTYLCSHATGTPAEYVENAIKGGIRYMGFADHIPYINKAGKESFYRVPYDKAKYYIDTVCTLKEKYKDQIEISVGFESEYYPDVFLDMVSYAKELGGEYLILGPHFLTEAHTVYVADPTDSVALLKDYVLNITEAMKSGVFTYVAHPDLIYFTGGKEVYQEEMRKICKASAALNVPLEINFLGLRANRHYPCEAFWQLAGEEKSPVTFGFDSHAAKDACDKASLKRAEALVETYHLNYIGKPSLIRL